MEPTKNQIDTMSLKGYTIIEYNGADGRVTYKTSSGELRSSGKLSALLSNIRKSLLSKEIKLKKKQEKLQNKKPSYVRVPTENIKVIQFIHSQNLRLVEPYGGQEKTYHIHCDKHNITIERKLCNLDIHNRKIKSLCPECRKEEYVSYYNSLGKTPNIIIKRYWNDGPHNHKRMECECKFCNHVFERYHDDIFRQGINDCPKCGLYRKRNLPHLYEKYEAYREECDRFTTINISRFKDILNPIEGLTVDHRFSCRNGYDNHIPPWIVSMPYNLEWISMLENNIKSKKNSLTISELFVKFGEFLKEHPWYGESFDKSFVK
jgi:hypothetical protein